MLTLVRFWILLSTGLVSAGWILSAVHQLNRLGYGFFLVLAGIAAGFWWKKHGPTTVILAQTGRKLRRRFKRPAPFLFLVLATMSLVSGLLYAPYNSDTDAYRFPRMLHWLGQSQWHWIHTAEMRMNIAGCGYEWLATPVLLFTRTDRFLFLINWASYLLLPGLIFCVFRLLGLRTRVAWWWTWLLASGWCYVMQSASVANDGLAAVYALAAVALVLKLRELKKTTDFWLALLAAALLTGSKQTASPLAALWLLAAWPERQIVFTAKKTFLIMVSIGLLVSGVPIMVFNCLHTGTWDGVAALQAEYPDWHIQLDSPFWGMVGNAFYIPVLSLLPPFFPWSGAWNHAMEVFLATPFGVHFRSFEQFGAVSPGISESTAGIGLAIIVITAISMVAARKYPAEARIKPAPLQIAWRLCPWVLLLIFMAKVGVVQNVRFLAGYYVFFFPSLLAGTRHAQLVRQGWWQKLLLLGMTSSVLLLMVNPVRPLFPAMTVMRQLASGWPHSKAIAVLQDAYSVAPAFQSASRQIGEKIPADERLVGYAAVGNARLEPSLWFPLGLRKVERVLKTDPPERLRQQGVRYVVIEDRPSTDCPSIDNWMSRYHAHLVAEFAFQEKGHDRSQVHAYVARLDDR